VVHYKGHWIIIVCYTCTQALSLILDLLFYSQEEYSGQFGQYEEGNEMFFAEFSR